MIPDIETLLELERKASKGPWSHDPKYPMFIGHRHALIRPQAGALCFGVEGPIRWDNNGKNPQYDDIAKNDCAFVAAIRNNARELLELSSKIQKLIGEFK